MTYIFYISDSQFNVYCIYSTNICTDFNKKKSQIKRKKKKKEKKDLHFLYFSFTVQKHTCGFIFYVIQDPYA